MDSLNNVKLHILNLEIVIDLLMIFFLPKGLILKMFKF